MWQTSGQLNADCFSLRNWLPDLTEMHQFIGVYKLVCGEPCPRCHVMIIHTGGCKFMKCEKCQYEFCWYCLDEFYTEFHYYYTNCPFRYCLFHSIEVGLAFIILFKIMAVSPLIKQIIYLSIILLWYLFYGLSMMFFGMKAIINKKKQKKVQIKLHERLQFRREAFRNQDRALTRRI